MNSYGFQFKKKYGQNFIKEEAIVSKIADVAEMGDNALVIEIGPGSGMLTKQLAKRAKHVLAYEIDTRLETILDTELAKFDNVTIIFADFLNRDIKEDLKDYKYDSLYVVANLPYYITTPIITKLIEEEIPLEKIVIMVQKEVGDRFSASEGTRDYNSLSVFLKYYFTINKEFVVNRNFFVPKPNVDSIVISLTARNEKIKVDDLPFFFTLVRDSFKFKRKNLKNNLRAYNLLFLEKALNQLGKDLTIRAEQLSIEEFVFLSNSYISDNLDKGA